MKSPEFITISGKGYSFDYPKDAPLPEVGDSIFIDGIPGSLLVTSRNFHINKDKLFMVTINTKKKFI